MTIDNGLSLSRDPTRPRDQKVMLLYRQELIKLSYHSAKVVVIGTLVRNIL